MFVHQLIYPLLKDKSISLNTGSAERTYTKQIKKHTRDSFSHYIKTKVSGKPKNMTHTIITFHCPSMQKIPQLPNSVAPPSSLVCTSSQQQASLHMVANSGKEEHQTITLKLPFSQKHRLPFFCCCCCCRRRHFLCSHAI